MIDFHCHLLPALDDGAVNVDESIVMARSLSDFGCHTVYCTPHCIKGYYDLTPQKVREATLMLQADLDNAEISLELRPGMEYMLDECFSEFASELLPLGDTKLVLCEAPQQAHHGFVQEGLELIIKKGFVPLIAHPERTDYFYDILSQHQSTGEAEGENHDEERTMRDAGNLQKKQGLFARIWPFAPRSTRHVPLRPNVAPQRNLPACCLFQANLGSFTGYYGDNVQRKAYELLKHGVYSALATDLHDGASASKILECGKFETNPLLEKLAAWDGSTEPIDCAEEDGAEQGKLF